jgi:hypothetical protein
MPLPDLFRLATSMPPWTGLCCLALACVLGPLLGNVLASLRGGRRP